MSNKIDKSKSLLQVIVYALLLFFLDILVTLFGVIELNVNCVWSENAFFWNPVFVIIISSKLFRTANQQVIKALRYAYVGRKEKKRQFRQLWITRINAAAASHNIKYNVFINKLKKANINLNRKMLSQLAILDPITFSKMLKSIIG